MRGRPILAVCVLAACGGSNHSAPDAAAADGPGSDDVSAGLLDVADFPPAWRGPNYMGGPSGTYGAANGLFNGTAVVFLPLPFTTTFAQLKVGASGLGGHGHTPSVYRFDPGASQPACAAPPASQGDIFTLVPDGSDYVPVVAEVPVTSHGETCDAIKSEATLLVRTDVSVGSPDGTYRLEPILDPRAATLDLPAGHAVPIASGWFDRYQLAYIDGPTIPTMSDGTNTVLLSQILFVPDAVPDGSGGAKPGTVSSGFALFQFQRGDPGYSPICHVMFFQPPDPTIPATSFSQVQPSELDPDTGLYIICMQL